jgi:hypothetical protein
MDCTTKYLACGGKTPFVLLYDIDNYFNDESLPLKIYQLPEGFSKGISKLQFLRGHQNNCRLAMLMGGVFVLAEVVSNESSPEEFKVEDGEGENATHLKILSSIKLPSVSILDFDIDRNNAYVSLVSSDGLVKIYDIEKLQKNDAEVTEQKVRMSSRDTISYYKYFLEVTSQQMLDSVRNNMIGAPETGVTFDDSFKMKNASYASYGNTFDRFDGAKHPG